jgi:hypothetical protein
MIEQPKKPEQYRHRAAECRKIARRASTPELRAEYEDLADRYDELADAEEKLEEFEKRMRRDPN